MQRDMKIGMALGLALVGIVGALFFRREPEIKDKETPPPLQNAEELDREIAGRAKAPYIKGLEAFDSAAAPVPPAARPSTRTKDEESTARQQGPDAGGRKPAPAAPDPIGAPQSSPTDALANDQIPAHNRNWEATGPSSPAGKKAAETRSNPAGTSVGTGRTHVIKSGETLSALASRYLGSSGRYREIYEANRSVLRSPDDVREGLSIVIPDVNTSGDRTREPRQSANATLPDNSSGNSSPGGHSTKAQRASARTVKPDVGTPDKDETGAATEAINDRPREKIRFVPVPSGPFSAGRVSARGGSAKPDSRKPAAPTEESLDENE
jgi:hypothetical protein